MIKNILKNLLFVTAGVLLFLSTRAMFWNTFLLSLPYKALGCTLVLVEFIIVATVIISLGGKK